MNGGTSTVYFDWLSASNTSGTEGVYCLQLTADDQDNTDLTPATTTVVIDNKAPSQPGIFAGASSTKDSVKLYYGATSSDLHFLEYRIYYATSSDINENDYMHASTTDIALDDVLFLGEASTTISGLLENTTYYFSVFAYDEYGHMASSSVFSFKTNAAPNALFTQASPATLRTNASGIVDISVDVDDLDTVNAYAMAKLEYVQGGDCNFTTPLDPSLDESAGNISTSYGLVSIENDNDYQIGNSNGYILTPATNTVAFDWLAINDVPDANDTYCLRLTANDLIDDQNISATATLTLDMLEPSSPGSLSEYSKSTSTITLNFGSDTIETNFSHYEIHYKQGTSGVSLTDASHTDTNLSAQDYNSVGSTTIKNLSPNTDYVINIWAIDTYGNMASATEITIKTDANVANVSLSLLNPVTSNWIVVDGASEYTFEAVVSEESGWNVLDETVLRLANSLDAESPYSDLEFTWDQTSDTFTETRTDINDVLSIAPSSSSICSGNTCTLNFNLIFNKNFTDTSLDYSAELLTTNDSAVSDFDTYLDFYQAKLIWVEQIHYRWRNDDGGE